MKTQARQTTEEMINEKDEREKEENGYTKVDQLGDKTENFSAIFVQRFFFVIVFISFPINHFRFYFVLIFGITFFLHSHSLLQNSLLQLE